MGGGPTPPLSRGVTSPATPTPISPTTCATRGIRGGTHHGCPASPPCCRSACSAAPRPRPPPPATEGAAKRIFRRARLGEHAAPRDVAEARACHRAGANDAPRRQALVLV